MNNQLSTTSVRARLLVAAAVASVAMLALPSAASASHPSPVPPLPAVCPTTAGPVVNAACFVLQGIDYAARHGGAVGAATEAKDNTVANAFAFEASVDDAGLIYAETMAAVAAAFKTAVDTSTGFFEDAVDAGLLSVAVDGQTWAEAIDDNTLGPPAPVACPLNSVNSPVFQGVYGFIRTTICARWTESVAIPSVNAAALQQHLEALPVLLVGKLPAFEDAINSYRMALEDASNALKTGAQNATGTLANLTQIAAETLAVEQIIETWYSVQCARKGDYGPFSRPDPPNYPACPQ